MATKIYLVEGLINVDDGVDSLFSINPSEYTFKKVASNYYVRDNINKITHDLGIASNIQDLDGNAIGNDAAVVKYLNVLSKGLIDIAIQDQTTPDISIYLGQTLDTFTIFSDRTIDDESFDIVTTGVLPVVGNFIFLKELEAFSQLEISSVALVAGNRYTIGVSMPLDFAYTTAAVGQLQNCNQNIDGTAPKKFHIDLIGLLAGTKWDITRMIITSTMTTSGDDGKFANLAALTVGLYYRTKNGITKNLFNMKENSDLGDESAGDVSYPVRSGGGGTFGMRGRVTFNGPDKRGVVKRLVLASSDEFQGFVRDNLTDASLIRFRTKIQGQVVKD